MLIIKKINYAIVKIVGFFQYHFACTKNHYPCRLLGEKRSPDTNNAIIIFRNIGETRPIEISVKELLAIPSLVAYFHPKEALKLGSIALEEFIFELPKSIRKQQFNIMKNIMLNSTNSISRNNNFEAPFFQNFSPKKKYSSNVSLLFIKQAIKNIYPFKLVGGRVNKQTNDTVIIYTILGKREGHEKNLHDLINNIELLEKFHPTEAIKFGFISLGDSLFKYSKPQKRKYSQFNEYLVSI